MPNNETTGQLWSVIRALAVKFGPEVKISKAEFMDSLQKQVTMQFQPDGKDEILIRVWNAKGNVYERRLKPTGLSPKGVNR